jgi:hypothetical protein
MLQVSIDTQEIHSFPVRALTNNTWPRGVSFAAFEHPIIESAVLYCLSNESILLLVRETDQLVNKKIGLDNHQNYPHPVAVNKQEFEKIINNTLHWQLNCICIEITYGLEWQIKIHASHYLTCPVYFTKTSKAIFFNWDHDNLLKEVGILRPNKKQIARVLAAQDLDSGQTILQDMWQIPPSSITTITDKEVAFEDAHVDEIQVYKIKDDINIVEVFGAHLQSVLQRWQSKNLSAGVELSGGVDSSTVAMALATNETLTRSLETFAIISSGESGKQQTRRRNAIVSKIKSIDITISGESYLPSIVQGVPPWPTFEYYSEIANAYIAMVKSKNINTLYTGHGGDELGLPVGNDDTIYVRGVQPIRHHGNILSAEYWKVSAYEAKYSTLVPPTTLFAAQTRAVIMMRHGIWLVHPFALPEMTTFCMTLPVEWRQGRKFMVEYLSSMGVEKDWFHLEVEEGFGEFFKAISDKIVVFAEQLKHGAITIDLGIVDQRLLNNLIEMAYQEKNDYNVYPLFLFIRMERFLRWYLNDNRGI